MPSLAVPMNPLADVTFIGMGKKLPVDWSQPTGDPAADHYSKATSASEKVAVPEPMCYFMPHSTNKYHVDSCKKIGKVWKDFVHTALDQTKNAVDMWRMQAKFKDVKVMSTCAIGTPGCLDGPELKDCYVGWVGTGDNEKKYIKAVKEGISDCWDAWASKVTIPGLPWYPAFAAFPLAMAPPVPNVPTPLIMCPSAGQAKMTAPMLRDAMIGKLDSGIKSDDTDKHHEAAFMAIGTGLATAFLAWLPMQQVMNVMGKGPVPTYAPPYVPAGPVLNGDVLPIPGHLMA